MNTVKKLFGISKSKYKEIGIPEELLSIYKKPKNYRTLKDNLFLIQKNDHLNCFQKILKTNKEGELIYETIIKNLDFAIYEPGKVIYYPKDMITNLFYIFHGSVKVDKTQYNNFPSPIKTRSQNIKVSKNKKLSNNIKLEYCFSSPIKENYYEENFRSGDNDDNSITTNIKYDKIKNLGFFKKLHKAVMNYKIYKEIKNKNKNNINDENINDDIIIIEKGDEYGQNDLNLPKRLDLVETKTYCVIGFLSKHNYKYIFEKTDALKKNDILYFLKSLKILQEVNNEVVINNIYNAIKERRIYRGEYLIKSGENSDKFFIIRKGDFQVNLNIKQKVKNQFNDLNYFGHFTLKEKSKNIKYEIKNYYINDEKYKIVTYGEGEIIGDIELYLDSKIFLTDIFCNTDSSLVYEINFCDFNINSNRTMKELLLKEGFQKLKYFRKRIYDIKKINSKKMDNINRFKEIISNKLEEEKGEIFNQIENNESGRYKYEKKQRKRLKSASINNKLKNIIQEINEQKLENFLFNYKNKNSRNNYLFKNRENRDEFPIFPTSIKNKNYKLITNENDIINKRNNNSILKTNFTKYISKLSSKNLPKNYKKAISLLCTSTKNTNLFFKDKINFHSVLFSPNIKNLKSSKIKKKIKFEEIKKKTPETLNERFQNIFTKLFINKKNRKNTKEDSDSINNLNYYNTQNSLVKKTTDYSKNSLNTFSQNINRQVYGKNNDMKIFWSLKKEDQLKFLDNQNKPLLTEIIIKRKNALFKKLSSSNHNNYNKNIKQ